MLTRAVGTSQTDEDPPGESSLTSKGTLTDPPASRRCDRQAIHNDEFLTVTETSMSDEPQQVPIPQPFHSVYLDGPFERCVDCECDLLGDETPYTIVKHVVGTEPVFEMAICLDCAAKLRAQYSEETQRRLNEFLQNAAMQRLINAALPPASEPPATESSADETPETPPFTWEDGIAECFACGKPRSACRRYELAAVCLQTNLIVQPPTDIGFMTPFLLCDDCNSQVSKLISKQTRDAWDRFMEDHFDGPPGIELDSPRMDPVLI